MPIPAIDIADIKTCLNPDFMGGNLHAVTKVGINVTDEVIGSLNPELRTDKDYHIAFAVLKVKHNRIFSLVRVENILEAV